VKRGEVAAAGRQATRHATARHSGKRVPTRRALQAAATSARDAPPIHDNLSHEEEVGKSIIFEGRFRLTINFPT